MEKLTKQLITEMIDEYMSPRHWDRDRPLFDISGNRTNDSLTPFEGETERIVSLIHDLTKSVSDGHKGGDLSQTEIEKISDFQLTRIQRALDYAKSTMDVETGEDLDMTTPEV